MSTNAMPPAWSRRHLLGVLGALAVTVVLLIAGLVNAVGLALDSHASQGPARPASADRVWPVNVFGVRSNHYRDQVAAAPMLQANADDMQPAPPSLHRPGRMLIGAPTKSGPANVPSGFAHTPEGAVGQLAAIEIATLTPMSLEYAREVHQGWSMPGAPFSAWELAQSIQAFHAHAGTVDGDGSVSITATPVGAQIKGTDGPDWVLACVQLDVTVIVAEQTRFGYGHCERMQWTDRRWMIGAGRPPAPAPSTWPASQRSLDAGWLLWVDQADQQ